jgi:hypothetical protein
MEEEEEEETIEAVLEGSIRILRMSSTKNKNP